MPCVSIRQVSDSIAQLHSVRFVHGDIAKRNYLVDDGGNVFLTDFGKAHWLARCKAVGSS